MSYQPIYSINSYGKFLNTTTKYRNIPTICSLLRLRKAHLSLKELPLDNLGVVARDDVPTSLCNKIFCDKERELRMDKLVVGITNSYYPFNQKTNSGFIGYDIDLCQALENNLGIDVTYQSYDTLQEIFSAILENKVDIVLGGIIITPNRKEFLNFADPYFINYVGIAFHLDKFKSIEEIDKPGVKIGVVPSSLGSAYAQSKLTQATTIVFDTVCAAAQSLLKKEIDVLVNTDTWVQSFQAQYSDGISMFSKLGLPEYVSIGVSKDNDMLLKTINTFLKDYKVSEIETESYNKWFSN